MSHLFTPLYLPSQRGGITLPNRIVVAPMCQYQAQDGCATDWHLMHWGSLLNSGAAMFTIEATAVLPEGRITPNCLGLWDARTEAAMAEHLRRARALAPSTAVCIQLAHAGRKASSAVPWQGGQLLSPAQGGWQTVGPSAVPHLPSETPPQALTPDGLRDIVAAFVAAAQRADHLGVDAIELHCAHGYLLHQFLSPWPTSAAMPMAARLRTAAAFRWRCLPPCARLTVVCWGPSVRHRLGGRCLGSATKCGLGPATQNPGVRLHPRVLRRRVAAAKNRPGYTLPSAFCPCHPASHRHGHHQRGADHRPTSS